MTEVPLFWKLSLPAIPELERFLVPGMTPVEHLHVTLLYVGGKAPTEAAAVAGLDVDDYRLTFQALQAMQGKEVSFEVSEVLKHESMVVCKAEIPENVPCVERRPHLTLCMEQGVRPVQAKELLASPAACEVTELSPPLRLQGTVELQSGVNSKAAAPGDATSFTGSLLQVETNPRPSRSSEPTGNATFIDQSQVSVYAAKLAASVKEQAPGPAAWKMKARVQAADRPGDIYLKWAAVAGSLEAQEICQVLEDRLRELM